MTWIQLAGVGVGIALPVLVGGFLFVLWLDDRLGRRSQRRKP